MQVAVVNYCWSSGLWVSIGTVRVVKAPREVARSWRMASTASIGHCHRNVYLDRWSRSTPHARLVFAPFPATWSSCQARHEVVVPTAHAALTLT